MYIPDIFRHCKIGLSSLRGAAPEQWGMPANAFMYALAADMTFADKIHPQARKGLIRYGFCKVICSGNAIYKSRRTWYNK